MRYPLKGNNIADDWGVGEMRHMIVMEIRLGKNLENVKVSLMLKDGQENFIYNIKEIRRRLQGEVIRNTVNIFNRPKTTAVFAI